MGRPARTWRCLSCGDVYCDRAPNGMDQYHVCRGAEDPATAAVTPVRTPRDERIVQDRPGGPERIRQAGRGRGLLAMRDLVSGATPAERAQLRTLTPVGPLPYPEDVPTVDPRAAMPAVGE